MATKTEHLERLKAQKKTSRVQREREEREAHERNLLRQATQLAAQDAEARQDELRRNGMVAFMAEHRVGAVGGAPRLVTVEVTLRLTR